jgi:hypothetical protein
VTRIRFLLVVIAILLALNLIGLPDKEAYGAGRGQEHTYVALVSFDNDTQRQHQIHRRVMRIRSDGICEYRTLELGGQPVWISNWTTVNGVGGP